MDNKIYFVFNNNNLLVKSQDNNICFPNENDIRNLGLDICSLDFLTSKGNQEFLFGETKQSLNKFNYMKFLSFRSLSGLIDESLYYLAGKAFHLINWDNTYKFCSRCGSIVVHKQDERAKACPKCNLVSYPKISPAVITAIIKENKLLLAHNTNFPNKMHSVIAGFVEPGETFEECVSREVFEETGIKVKNIKYFGSQPWPFPDSLMIAFICEYASGELKIDGIELDHASWYSADELPNIPVNGSIARKLIDWFVDNFGETSKN
ncbi:NAD(+) diphosphatase [Clostridium sp. DJ247]|uniref:NAD(+) diphosphatase n=1 Tax=Clostridium sp. DJ247 TaxID=2726188 RepID=UPI001626679E|nr:NAD(+) diphosphatase [Clostridium sp. DJ247]MBC2581817.1 NAD(+) diphosphatase [Clostridium sp. DJ247]